VDAFLREGGRRFEHLLQSFSVSSSKQITTEKN
jgi:hypothetical protein